MNIKTVTILVIIHLVIFNNGELNAQTNDYSNSLNRYSFDLYHKTKIEKENLFISPLSTYYTLLVAYKGSKKKTKQEFEKVLYLKNISSSQNNYLQNIDSCYGLKVSNAFWLDKSLHVESSFRKSVTNRYFSDFKQIDYTKPELAISQINRWVSEKTNHRINEIVSDADINSSTKLLISNTVYFKGEWLNKFKKQKTISAPFFTNAENQYKVDFMKMTESLQYYETDEYQFISKPYKNSGLSFCILLPKKLFGIDNIEKKMSNHFFKQIIDNTYSIKTALSIPKLKLESNYELSDALQSTGLKTAFTGEADFSGITKETPVQFSKFLHKTWIELDEEKTEAAAATATVTRITGLPSYKIFNADHPFVFFVIDIRSKAILFMGRYVKPTNGEKIEKERLSHNLDKRKQEKFGVGKAGNGVLLVLDNKIISQDEFLTINPNDIESMNVYMDNKEVAKYSTKNYDGVVVFKLKKAKK